MRNIPMHDAAEAEPVPVTPEIPEIAPESEKPPEHEPDNGKGGSYTIIDGRRVRQTEEG